MQNMTEEIGKMTLLNEELQIHWTNIAPLLTMRNETAWWHTMHIHGFSMRVLTRNGAPVPYLQWQDSVLMAPKDIVECAFVADNPGNWMLHCHVVDHSMTGLMTVFHVT